MIDSLLILILDSYFILCIGRYNTCTLFVQAYERVWAVIILLCTKLLLFYFPCRTLANYMFWRAVQETLTFLTKAIRDRSLQYYKVLKGIKKQNPRWEVCLVDTITR